MNFQTKDCLDYILSVVDISPKLFEKFFEGNFTGNKYINNNYHFES